jgi:hypothetical protein
MGRLVGIEGFFVRVVLLYVYCLLLEATWHRKWASHTLIVTDGEKKCICIHPI